MTQSTLDQQVMQHYVSLAEINTTNPTIKKIKQQAKQALLTNGLPTKKDEEWQYTSLESWKNTLFGKNRQGGVLDTDLSVHLPAFKTFKLTFVDGVFNEELSDYTAVLPSGCKLSIIDDEPLLPSSTDTFSALFTLTTEQTIVINVDENVLVDIPIHIVQIGTQQSLEALGIKINLAKSAQCKIIHQFIGGNEHAKFNNSYTEVQLASRAVCEQFIVQNLNKKSFYFNNQVINQAKDSIFKTHYINIGSAVARHKNIVTFDGEHCESYQSSVMLGDGEQVADSRTVTNHNMPNCESYQLHKFVLDDHARGVFNGMIYVAQDAQKTDGNMDNRNLLLSNTAKMDTKPQLEIYADDVLCSHGCTSGQIDKNQLFYCQARGISKENALALITKAFVLEPLDSINNQPIKEWLATLIQQKLAKEI